MSHRRSATHHYPNPRNATIRALIERGLAEGRLNPALAPDTVRDLLFGPLIYHWLVTGHLTTATANSLADAACAAVRRASPPTGRAGGTAGPGR
ncbi:TetR-like C-terminal domain-containing protein [Actinomadura coerulea]|uniref:TetR-like C-terminal domain-containing protein n=1 Tax=Actinomadura coerulea TaxID=46159 RepID=UPI003B837CFF